MQIHCCPQNFGQRSNLAVGVFRLGELLNVLTGSPSDGGQGIVYGIVGSRGWVAGPKVEEVAMLL